MRTYELMTISKASIGDEKAKTVSKEIQDLVVAGKGDIKKDDYWGKRKFAYEIKGAKEGYYDILRFQLDPTELPKINSKIKLMDSVLRYLVTSVSE